MKDTGRKGKARRERALYVLEFRSYSNPRVWIRSFDYARPFRNKAIAEETAAEAGRKSGDKYRVVKYVRERRP